MSTSSNKRPVLDWWAQYMTNGTTFPNLAFLKSKAHGGGGGTTPTPSVFKQMQLDVQNGLGPSIYPNGTDITVHHATYGDLVFGVAAHDHFKKPGDDSAHTMTLVMKSAITGIQFDSPEALYAVTEDQFPNGLQSGTYYFEASKATNLKWSGIQFTISKPVPVGGQILYSGSLATTTVFQTYASPKDSNPIEDNIPIQNGTEGTLLGSVSGTGNLNNAGENTNPTPRVYNGDENWRESNVRQWLNSNRAAGKWWNPTHKYDRCDSKLNGFLFGMEASFLSSIGEVDVVTKTCKYYENDGQQGDNSYTTRDKFFLLSYDEVGFGTNTVPQGSILPIFTSSDNKYRKRPKLNDAGNNAIWWLRSPYDIMISPKVSVVGISGQKTNESPYKDNDIYGVVPACVIY